jgi:hypothetical protein
VTATLPDTADMTAFEFARTCQVVYAVVCPIHGRPHDNSERRPCPNEAKWIGHFPCCGDQTYVCKPHHDEHSPWWCPDCQVDIPPDRVTWIPL